MKWVVKKFSSSFAVLVLIVAVAASSNFSLIFYQDEAPEALRK